MDPQQKTVLIIDDDIEFTNNLAGKLQEVGLSAHVAVSGKEALEYIANNKVDFIILDFIMPEMDGFEFYRTMRHDMRLNIPTIVLTNMTGAKDENALEIYVKSETDLGELVGKIKDRVTTA